MPKMIHSMIRVSDEARSVEFYEKALRLAVKDRYPMDGFTLVYLRDGEGEFELELTVNEERTKGYELGDAYGHLAVSVEDVDAEHDRLQGMGFAVTDPKALSFEGEELARFFFLTDPDGYKIEVLRRGGRYL
ncbi:MAG: VOC family protein [Gluconacetobacter diazotrophicus]|nr:VOC family protein [Gluconacetobacter diazotrophicus]